MMMIMTPSNWLKDSAGQTRMESIKDPAPPNRPKNKIILGQNIDYSTCLDQEGNEGGVERATEYYYVNTFIVHISLDHMITY